MSGRFIFDLAPARGDRFFLELLYLSATKPHLPWAVTKIEDEHAECRRREAEAASPPSRIPDAPWRR